MELQIATDFIRSTDKYTRLSEQLDQARNGAVTSWIIDGIIVENGKNMLYAAPGTAKSMIALDLAFAAAEGRKWLGLYEVQRQPVLYVDEDGNNAHELNSRLLKFASTPELPIFFRLHQGFDVLDASLRKEIVEYCQSKGINLVIIDSFTRIHSLIEGDANNMKQVNAALKHFNLNGLTLVVLHHSQKRGTLARGSSEIESGFDQIYRVSREGKSSFRIHTEKSRSVGSNGVWPGCTVEILEQDGRLHIIGDETLDDDASHPNGNRSASWRAEVVDVLSYEDEATKTDLMRRLGVRNDDRESFQSLLERLVDEGVLEADKRGKGYYYSLLGDGSED